MNAQNTYRVVGVRADGSKRVLCDKLQSGELAERIACHLTDKSPFASIVIEPEDVRIVEPSQDGQSNP
jgi:hypothetical protein